MKKGTERKSLKALFVFLEKASKKNKAPIWMAVAEKICSPRRRRVEVNVGKLSKIVKQGSAAVVPGKLLSTGKLERKLDVASVSASKSARDKVAKAGGRLMSIRELVEANPKGAGVVIVQ